MTAKLSIISPGLLATFQDFGRNGLRRYGVPRSGVLHPDLALIANALAENDANEAVLEFFHSGPCLRAESNPVRFAFAGDFSIRLVRQGKSFLVRSWRTLTLEGGDILYVGPVTTGKAGYVAVCGGFGLSPVLGSCSTYLRGGFGGLGGRQLQTGDVLEIKEFMGMKTPEHYLPNPPERETFGGIPSKGNQNSPLHIRVIPGPQDDYFTDKALKFFLSCTYTITRASDRMGIRLDGPALDHCPDLQPEIISDGIMPGAIQVPGSGLPIALLADAQTVGGYPKIATVVTVDLPKLAVLNPGRHIHFKAVTAQEGADLLLKHRANLEQLISKILPIRMVGRQGSSYYNNSLASPYW